MFVQVTMSASATLFKEGYILKKNIMDAPHKKGQCVFDRHDIIYDSIYHCREG